MSSPPFPLGSNYGSMFMSTLLCIGLWGVSCMQTFLYFVSYQDDKPILKILVLFVWLLDTTHQIMITQGVYTYFVPQFGNYSEFDEIVPTLTWAPLITTLVAIITQGFFVYRIWKFNEKPLVVPCLWIPAAMFELATSIVYVSKATNASSVGVLEGPLLKPVTIAYFAVTSSVDLAIAVSLTYMFINQARQTPGEDGRYKRMIHWLAIYSINSGAWTAVFSILDIILFVAFSSNVLYVVFDFPLCPIYCNMLLANLNVRSHLRGIGDPVNGKLSNDAASFIVHNCANMKDNEPEDVIFTHRVMSISRNPMNSDNWDDSLRSHPYSKGSSGSYGHV